MSLISANIPNFVNGISQQPPALRLPSQGSYQENGYSTVFSGLRKRMPTEHVAKILPGPTTDCFVHTINRDDIEQYQVIVTNGDLKVFDVYGNQRTVTFTDKSYLNCTGPVNQSFAITTVADYTFIANRGIKVASGVATQPSRPHEAMIYVKSGNFGKTYSVTVDNAKRVTVLTPNGLAGTGDVVAKVQVPGPLDTSGNPTWMDNTTSVISGQDEPTAAGTDVIAKHLYDMLASAGYNTGSWSLKVSGSIIYLSNSAVDFKLSSDDGFGNNAMVVIKDKLQKFSDLPALCSNDGFTVQIVGTDTSTFDNFWVNYSSAGADANAGIWKECLAPGTVLGLDVTTMPHQLVRNADLTFTFGPAPWLNRVCGDSTSSPNPSLVGRKVNDVFFFQNRLGFLADESFIQSEVGRYFNLFRTTVTTLLDSDPVDVNAATNKVAILDHAVTFAKNLILFSKMQQFIVDSSVLMSPKKVPIRPTTDFVTNTNAKPASVGKNLYFTSDKGAWSAVREFYPETISTISDAADVTAHVPMYLPSGVTKIAAGANENVLVFLTPADPSKLWVYKFFFSGDEKLQSSWSHFSVNAGGKILNCEFIKSILYLVVSRPDGTFLEKMDFALGSIGPGEPYQVLLDRKVQVPKAGLTYNAGTVQTYISPASIGYTPSDGATYNVVLKGGGGWLPGTILPATWNGVSMVVAGDLTGTDLTFGQTYSFLYTLSPLLLTLPQGGSKRVVTDGRTQVRKITFSHADSGFYNVLVTPAYRQTYTYTFSGAYLGTNTAILGTQALNTDRFSAAVMCRNTDATIQVSSSLPMPLSITQADWEAFHVDRSQNV